MHRIVGLAFNRKLATACSVAVVTSFATQVGRPSQTQAQQPTWRKLPNPSDKTVEKVSGTAFPNAIVREDFDEKLMRLCAVSIRCMMGMCFLDRARAYAFGVYLSGPAVETIVKANGDLTSVNPLPNEHKGAASFYPSNKFAGSREGYMFQQGEAGLGYYRDTKSTKWSSEKDCDPMIIRLIMLHDVDGEHLANGFDKTLRNRVLPKLKESKEELEQLTRFKTCLKRIEMLPKGTNLDL